MEFIAFATEEPFTFYWPVQNHFLVVLRIGGVGYIVQGKVEIAIFLFRKRAIFDLHVMDAKLLFGGVEAVLRGHL